MVATVLFASVRNAGRTQMATAWFNALAHPDRARAISAGTNPADVVDHQVVKAMVEAGLDIASCKPRLLTAHLASSADLFIVVAPPLLAVTVEGPRERSTWQVDDPLGESPERIREVEHNIQLLVRQLLVARRWMPLGATVPPSSAR